MQGLQCSFHTAHHPFILSPRSATKSLASPGLEKKKTVLRAWLEHIFSSLYCPSPQRAGLSVHTLVATVSRGGSGWEKDAAKAPRSSIHALQDGHAAVITGATLQRWLLLHAARCGVKSERFVCAFPILVSTAQDVNLPSTHCQATALLESRRKD